MVMPRGDGEDEDANRGNSTHSHTAPGCLRLPRPRILMEPSIPSIPLLPLRLAGAMPCLASPVCALWPVTSSRFALSCCCSSSGLALSLPLLLRPAGGRAGGRSLSASNGCHCPPAPHACRSSVRRKPPRPAEPSRSSGSSKLLFSQRNAYRLDTASDVVVRLDGRMNGVRLSCQRAARTSVQV